MAIVGIDLGTTNSLVAYWTEDGPRLIPNAFGEHMTPSVVSISDEGEIFVGRIGRERSVTHPSMTAYAFKRYMGTEKRYHLGDKVFSPQELSSFVLRSLRDDAEAFLGEKVTEAIISVPAYFSDAQRKATKQAAELAGLYVERLVSEPTAAALAYGLHQKEAETKFLVFDLGGGTFDVSILEMFEGVMEVKSIAGDNFLGGEDFRNLLADHFIAMNNLKENDLTDTVLELIRKQAETCKCELSDKKSGVMTLFIDERELTLNLDRLEFEKLCSSLLAKLRHPVVQALKDAELSTDEINAVILIGGATRMPIVRNIVAKMFSKLPFSSINPDEAVALGAAIQAALKERNSTLKEMILTDVCPYTLGINTAQRFENGYFESGYFEPIIERCAPIPISRVKSFVTVADNQEKMKIEIYQGESRKVQSNILLGQLSLKLLPDKAGTKVFDVRFTYDINGILEVEVVNKDSGKKERMIIEGSEGTLSPKEIEKRLAVLNDLKIHPRDRAENQLLLSRGERLYEEALGEKREYIANLLEAFEGVMETQDPRKVKKASTELKEVFDELEKWEY